MKLSDLIKVAAVGALVYGAYKLGQSHAKNKIEPEPESDGEFEDVEVVEEKSEKETVEEIINNLRKKPNKTTNDKNTLELLEIKLKQLLKGK